jgi:hypothetical protein
MEPGFGGQTSGTNNTSNVMQSRSAIYPQFEIMDKKSKNSRPITAIPKIKS